MSLQQVADADPGLDLGVFIASRHSATVGGAVATNAGGLRVLRYGPMRAQLRGIEAVLSDGTVLSHMSGLVKDNTGYDYPSLLAGSEGTLAVVTAARLQLVPRLADPVTVIVGADGPGEVHALARRAVREVRGLLSAEFFTQAGLDLLVEHAGLTLPLRPPTPAYLLLEAAGPGAAEELAELADDRPAAVGTGAAERARLWACRERHPEAAGFVGVPLKLDVSVPAARWVRLASEVAGVVAEADPGARVIIYGHVADGNLHVNVVPGVGVAASACGAARRAGTAATRTWSSRSWRPSAARSPPSTASARSRPAGCRWCARTPNAPSSPGSGPRSTRPASSTLTFCRADCRAPASARSHHVITLRAMRPPAVASRPLSAPSWPPPWRPRPRVRRPRARCRREPSPRAPCRQTPRAQASCPRELHESP